MAIIDFGIITGLTEEFEVLRKLFPPFKELSRDADIWYRTRVEARNGANYEIVAAFQKDMNSLNAQQLTLSLIKRWEPAYIILLGIAGSFHEEVELGDVIVSQQIFYYDLGKAIRDGIQYRPEGYPCSTVLIRQAAAFLFDEAFGTWRKAAGDSAAQKARQFTKDDQAAHRAALLAHSPKIHFGTVASGSLVIANKKKQRELLSLHGKILGTEMEGAGVLHATFAQELPTPAILIKGISDAADMNKAREDAKQYWRDLAKENSVRLVLELIRRGRIRPLCTDQFDLDLTLGSPAEAREVISDVGSPPISYLAFPRLVVPKAPMTELQIGIEVDGMHDERVVRLPISKKVVVYQNREGNRARFEDTKPEILLESPISAGPIGIYVLVRGKPCKVTFHESSPNTTKKDQWVPQS
jgi:nucleoside phosphorylase